MSKANLMFLAPPERKSYTRTFTDPDQPSQEVTLVCQPLSAMEKMLVNDDVQALLAEYGEDGIPLHSGAIALITPTTAQVIAAVKRMQVPGPEAYGEEELAAMMVVMPNAWEQVIAWTAELNDPKRAAKNSSAEDAALGSEPSSDATESTLT